MKNRLFLILFCILLSGCEKFYLDETTQPVLIYKPKPHYGNFVFVQVSPDGSKVVGYPTPEQIKRIVKLRENYFSANFWIDYACTSITLAEYKTIFNENQNLEEFLYQKIFDFEPFVEAYADFDRLLNPALIDSLFLDEIIARNELLKYFDRIK